MNVLSLFDGMSCGQIALDRAGIKVDKYFASEIDKYAIKVTQSNYPDTIQLGSVLDVKGKDLPKIDLLIGGSPCQGFSFAGKQLNFNDPRSKLFFEFVRVLKECQPKYFLLENVKMKQEYKDAITELLGYEPRLINSALISAQNRERLYWTNIDFGKKPKDKGILLKDIVHEYNDPDFDFETWLHSNKALDYMDRKDRSGRTKWDHAHHSNSCMEKSKRLTANTFKGIPYNVLFVPFDKTLRILEKEVEKGKVGYFRKNSRQDRVYYIHNKAITLCGGAGGGAAKMGQYLFGVINKPRGGNKGGLRNDGSKSPTLSSKSWEHNNNLLFGCTAPDHHGILIEGYIRKLTPIECERLQTVPDNYTNHVSNSQRYKMLGNGWTVDVIAHVFKGLDKEPKPEIRQDTFEF